ncbi:MAG: XdhC/CoxI family protein [Polyangiales bacterium]
MRDELVRALSEILASGERGALATVVRTGGSTPQRVGARMLLRADGRLLGTVGGGALELQVIERLRACAADAEAKLTVHELGHDLAMCCGGRMEVFVEPIEAQPRLWLCGAGHVAAATAPLLGRIGFEVTIVDEREELNTDARFPACARELLDPSAWLKRASLGPRDWLLIATHEHALDERVLELALGQSPRYIGMMGSKRKVLRLLERISARRGPVDLARLHAPVGLDLGAVGPEEIAVSIAAELIALRRGVAAAHLRLADHPRLAAQLPAPARAEVPEAE